MRYMFTVITFFIFESVFLITSDIIQHKNYSEEFKCHIPMYFEPYSAWYSVYWIFTRFMQSISGSLIAVVLMWRPKINNKNMD
jgi:hypothetical protein